MIISIVALHVFTQPDTEYRYRSYYCNRFKAKFHNLDETSLYSPGTDNTCNFGSYDKTRDDKLGLDMLNLVRWSAGYNNTVKTDDRFWSQQCGLAVGMRYNNYNISKVIWGNCGRSTADLTSIYTSIYSDKYPNAGSFVYHMMMTALNTAKDNTDIQNRGAFLHPNLSTTSFCGLGKGCNMKASGQLIQGQSQEPYFIAWPFGGPIDIRMIPKVWHMQSYVLSKVSSVKVTVNGEPVRLSGNRYTEEPFARWAGPKGVFFEPEISNYTENMVINVQIEDTNSLYNYTLYTTSCDTSITDADFDKKFGRTSYNYGQEDPTQDEGDGKKKSKAGVIVAVVIVLLLLIVGAIVGFFVWRKYCRKSSNDFYQPEETSAPVTQTTTTTTTTSSTSFGRTLTFESRQEEYSGGKANPDVNRKTIIIS